MTETVVFKQADWSDKIMAMEVDRDSMTFELLGYTFKLENDKGLPEDLKEGEFGYGFACHILGDSWTDPLGYVTKCNHEEYYLASACGITRESTDPFIAAAQLICNTV
jgi:hypothetical protein